MTQYLIGIELESSNTDDADTMRDIIMLLETQLPYMMDNVAVRSMLREDAETDSQGTPIIYFN